VTLQLYNSLTRSKSVFEPADPQQVTLYVCGPTVYNYPHIGNARPAVVFDVLYRLLKWHYPQVIYARNITDLEDKINAAAAEQGVGIEVITDRFTEIYHQDMQALGVLPPVIEPRASQHVAQMIAMIERLIELGNAYEADGHVLFEVETYADYGALSRRNRREMIAGARVEVAPYKRDAGDFVLWKPSSGTQPGWDSPWGYGRPGWHTECCAMIEEHLGVTIDIHGGGHDLQFPHHENEIAQSNCAHDGRPISRFWMHNGFVNVNSQKMSKSIGNVHLVRDLLNEGPGEAIRLALLTAHYRKPLEWNDETLARAVRTLDRLYSALEGYTPQADVPRVVAEEVLAALNDDLNTPQVIAVLHEYAHQIQQADNEQARREAQALLYSGGGHLGLLQQGASVWNAARRGQVADPEHIESLIAARNEARRERQFQRADEIRDTLLADGIILEDGPEGTTWRKAE
jgi:cysteinyl-tRNA synthetase